ncbi:hypothetical protein EC54115_11897 [Escherichia coli 541-15]|nr:hypothetical protein EC54115_11897 [Escherichia coli 541-15]
MGRLLVVIAEDGLGLCLLPEERRNAASAAL